MKTRQVCPLTKMYGHRRLPVIENSPELCFLKAVCAGNSEKALAVFRNQKLFGNTLSAVDAPYGRFEGLEGIRVFAETFLQRFDAKEAFVTPFFQTAANGRVALEAVVHFVVDGEINEVPMFVVGDFRTPQTLDEVRIYMHCTYVPGLTPYRHPIFTSAHLEMGDPGLLTGAMREYYEALHYVPAVDVERIMQVFADGCQFGGYERWDSEVHEGADREELRRKFEHMHTYIPACVGMRYETLIDDGKTCVIEWQHIVSREGQERLNRVCLAGCSAYERNEEGLLCSVRISDYAGYESQIDWSKTGITKEEAQAINFVETFPAGCGRKSQ